jgi:hypothetical protein
LFSVYHTKLYLGVSISGVGGRVISVFIALCAAVILDSGPLPWTSPALWDPEPASTIRLSVRDSTVRMHRSISP